MLKPPRQLGPSQQAVLLRLAQDGEFHYDRREVPEMERVCQALAERGLVDMGRIPAAFNRHPRITDAGHWVVYYLRREARVNEGLAACIETVNELGRKGK